MTPTISEAAVQASRETLKRMLYDVSAQGVDAALTAALPFLQGVKVKDEGKLLMDVTQAIFPEGWTMSNRNAVADGIRIVLSAIEVSGNPGQLTPSPRAQALDLSVLENLSAKADEYDYTDDNGPFPDIQDAMVSVGDLRAVRKLLPEIRALSQGTSSERAQALEEAHSDLINRLNDDIAQLERAAEQAKFAGSETGVRVKSPSVLLADLRDAAAAIRALSQPVSPDMGVERPVEGGWLPIETAPNNKAILIYYDDGNTELVSADDNDYSWIAYTVKEDFCTKPTHWRPLPQAPGVAV